MRVVHLCNLPLSEDHPDRGKIRSHPGRWVLNIALAQARHTEIEPEIIVQVPGASRDHSTSVEGIPVHFVAAPDKLRAATFFYFDIRRLAHAAKALKPDLVHAHGTEDAYGLAAQRTGLPNAITAQGLYFLINRTVKPRLISRARIVEGGEWLCFQRARHVIAKSQYVREHLAAKFPHLIFHDIPNTFDARLLEVNEPRESNTVVFVGTMSLWKGVHHLREALVEVKKSVPDVRLWIVGDHANPTGEYEIAEKRALTAALGDRVTFWGTRPFLETASLIARSSMMAAPSLQDMFGNQVIEALLLRTPVVTTEGIAMAENVRRFGNGVVVPQALPQQLAAAIVKMFSEPPSSESAQVAREKVVAFMSPERVATAHLEAYKTILKS